MNRKRMSQLLKTGMVKSKAERDLKRPSKVVSKMSEITERTQRNELSAITLKTTATTSVPSSTPARKLPSSTFRDSYLLTEKIRQLLGKSTERSDDAIALVTRNPKIATVEVYGTLISLLIRKSKYNEALSTYKEMLTRKITPNAQSYTLYLTALSRLAQYGSSTQKKECLFEANDLLVELGSEISRVHLNCFLKVCVSCADQGGWEKAFQIFENTKKSKLDKISFSIMLSLCAENRSEDGYKATLYIWNTFMKQRNEEILDVKDVKMRRYGIDAQLISNVLLTCIRVKKLEDAMFGMELVKEWIGLPLTTKETFINSAYRDEINAGRKVSIDTKSLDVLLRFASRVRMPDLALLWYRIAVKELDVQTDCVVRESVIQLCMEKKDYLTALDIAQKSPIVEKNSNRYALIVKVCEEAISKTDSKMYVDAFITAVSALWNKPEFKINPETFHFIFSVIYEKQLYAHLYPLLNVDSRRHECIEIARQEFENVSIEASQSLQDTMTKFLNAHWTSVDVKYHAEKNIFHRVEALRILSQILEEYLNFERGLVNEKKIAEMRKLELVRKQVLEVLEVWDFAEKAVKTKKDSDLKWVRQLEENY